MSAGLVRLAATGGGGKQFTRCGANFSRGVGSRASYHDQLEGALRSRGGHEVQLLLLDAVRGGVPVVLETGSSDDAMLCAWRVVPDAMRVPRDTSS